MFKVTQRVFVNNLLFQPNVIYQGQPIGISNRYIAELDNKDENEPLDELKSKRKHKRKRAKVRNVAILNNDKE